MTSRFPFGVIIGGVDKLAGPFGKAEGRLAMFATKARATGKAMSLALSAPIVAFGALTLRTAASFEASMNRVRAITGGTREEVALLEAQAMELGRTTQFTAAQVADAQGNLAQLGFTVAQIMAATPGTLDLAAASATDLATSAQLAAGVLKGYNFEVGQMARVSDVLTRSTDISASTLLDMGEAMRIAGPIAAGMGHQFEQTAAILGELADNQYGAALGGTALKSAIAKLIQPAAEARGVLAKLTITRAQIQDARGNVRPMLEILRLLERQGATTGDVVLLFGERAGPALASLLGKSENILAKHAKLLDADGAAARKAGIMMEGASGAMKKLASAFEGLQLAIAKTGLLEQFTALATSAAGWLTSLSESNPEVLKWGVRLAAVAAVIGPLILTAGALAASFSAIASFASTLLIPALTGLSTLIVSTVVPAVLTFTAALLANPLTWLVAVIAGVGVGLAMLVVHWDEVSAAVGRAWDWIKGRTVAFLDWMGEAFGKLGNLLPDWLVDLFGGSGGGATAQVRVSEEILAGAQVAAAGPGGAESHVTVDFKNLPRGTRVETEGAGGPVDLNLGWALSTP